MATLLSTFLAQVEILLGDAANTELSDANINAMIKAAVERYSKDRPDHATEDVTGDGGKYYDLASELTAWTEDFSAVLAIEYPAQAVSADAIPQYLEGEDWQDDYWVGSTRYLFLPNHSPAVSETIRIRYVAPYVWSGNPEETTTPAQHFYAICHLAAGLCCQAIAAKYSRTSDSTITADSVRHTSRAGEFARRAKEYIAFYMEHLGLGGEDGEMGYVPPAGHFVDLDTAPGWPVGRDYLYHSGDTR